MCVRFLCAILFSVISFAAFTQRCEVTYLMPYHLSVSDHQTSNLIFPYAIKSVDRGSADIIVQKAKGVENILQVKAVQQEFTPTNLSIVTSDGKFYSMIVHYAASPAVLNVSFKSVLSEDNKSLVTGQVVEEQSYQVTRDSIDRLHSCLHQSVTNQRVRLSLGGIYVKQDALYFQLFFENKALLDYPALSIRFFVRDRKRHQRTAIQENELLPLFDLPHLLIASHSRRPVTVGLHTFSLPRTKELIIQAKEENGGRTLELKVSAKQLRHLRRL